MASQLIQITDKPTLEKIERESGGIPSIIYVSNGALPICRDFTPKYEKLAEKHRKGSGGHEIRFCQLEFSSETSAMFKFSPNQLPVVVFLCKGPWSRTMMSPNVQQMESGIEEMMQKAGGLKN